MVQCHSYTANCYVIVTSDMAERYFDSVLSSLEIDDLYICDTSLFANPVEGESYVYWTVHHLDS